MGFLSILLILIPVHTVWGDVIRPTVDFRQPEILGQINVSKLVVRPSRSISAPKCDYGICLRDSEANFDEVDEQLWKLSRIHKGVEIGILEILGEGGEVLGLSEFSVGEKRRVAIDSKSLIRVIEKFVERGGSMDEIKAIGARHNHPVRLGNNGFFSLGDLFAEEGLRNDLKEHFNRTFAVRLSLLWWSKSSAPKDLWLGSFSSVQKMSGWLPDRPVCESALSAFRI